MGFDETIGQTIHARHEYALGDIVPGARFADVLGTERATAGSRSTTASSTTPSRSRPKVD